MTRLGIEPSSYSVVIQGPRSKFSSGGRGRGGGGLKGKQVRRANYRGGGGGESGGMLSRIILILTPLKCREMHYKLINGFLNYYNVAY